MPISAPRTPIEQAVRALQEGRLDEAAALIRAAIGQAPRNPQLLHLHSLILTEQGFAAEALDACRQALAIEPRAITVHSNLLMLLHYLPQLQAQEIFEEHRRWARQFTARVPPLPPPPNNRSPDRRLRVGYLSHNFFRHAVATFFEPILTNHDRSRFEIFLYANVLRPDAVTQRLKSSADQWRDIVRMDDARVAQLVRDDRIDILVDLIGHADGSRLLVPARKPAPVQMTYLGYPDTTGMEQMDYRITDAWHDPPGEPDARCTEKLLRIEGGAWAIRPDDSTPPVGPPPLDERGAVTFFSPNKTVKLTTEMLQLWQQILDRVPGSRLIILTSPGHAAQERIRGGFSGIDPARVELVTRVTPDEYLRFFGRVDIMLDTFPYNGHTTTCESLWMGVPVITLAGQTHVGRAGLSVLSSVGLEELVARTPEEYIEKAVLLAQDRDRLRELRRGMRDRLRSSPLLDGRRLAHALEAHYREAWTRWVSSRGAQTNPTAHIGSMSQQQIIQILQAALGHHQSGRIEQAEGMYRQVLKSVPDQPDALHLLGVLCLDRGQADEAQRLVGRAVEVAPAQATFHLTMGNVWRAKGNVKEAVQSWQRAAQLDRDLMEAHANLAVAFTEAGEAGNAEAEWREVTRLNPREADAFFQLGQLLATQRRFAEAADQFRHCLRINPTHFAAHNALGVALSELRDHAGAATAFARAAELSPRTAPFHMNLGHALRALERDPQAEAAFRMAIELSRSVLGGSYHGLAATLRDQGRLEEARASATEAVRLMPEFAPGYHNLANIEYDAGLIEQSMANFRRALERNPTLHEAHSSLLLLLHYEHGNDPQLLFDEHLAWARRHAEPLREKTRPHGSSRDPQGRLRVGYMSADLRGHPVGFSIEPVLAAHDRDAVEVVVYYNRLQGDAWTARIRNHCSLWRDVKHLSHDQLDQLIRDDGIDVLVDLAGHTAEERLLVFARRPAPVQITYLGYPDTTGMSAMDYKLTDAWQDPPGQTDPFYTEKLVRLPGGAWCFRPREQMPAVGALPADSNRFVTFICGNKIAKVTDRMLELWRQILQRLPGSRLILRSGGEELGEARVRKVLHDIDPARLEFAARGSFEDYFNLYNRSDIGLDSFPYNGYMTTCDSLWMGVPVITLAGQTHVTRTGVSLLSKVGLEQFICNDANEYIERAVAASSDLDALRELRRTMRQRLIDHGLTDGQRLAREIEAAYRQMWQIWCQTSG